MTTFRAYLLKKHNKNPKDIKMSADDWIQEAQDWKESLNECKELESTRKFRQACTIDIENDKWVFRYDGVFQMESKSQYDCHMAKIKLQKKLGI